MSAATPEPDPFLHAFVWPIAGRALSAAVMLGVFEVLATGPATPDELAERLSLDPGGADALLTTLAVLGYVRADADGRMTAAPVVGRLLVRDSPESIATFVGEQADLHWEILSRLPDVLRGGEPYRLHEDHQDHPRWEAYMRGLYEIQRAEQASNAAIVPASDPRRLVDVAGGHGSFSIAMCRRHPRLTATIVDLPASAAVGRRIVAEQGLAERIDFVEGDVFEVGLGEAPDVVSVFNLIHHLPEERDRELVGMAHAALRPGGWLAIGDSERPAPNSPSQHGSFSSLLFHAWSGGRNFTGTEISGWLEEAGFEDVEVHRNEQSPWRIVTVGRRPR